METGNPEMGRGGGDVKRYQRAPAGREGCQGLRGHPPGMPCTLWWRASDHRAVASSQGEVLKFTCRLETRGG